VLRLRYNISSTDVPININSTFNGANSPLKQDPFVYFDANDNNKDTSKNFLSLALNTNQVFRTFQDRSYVFAVRTRPSSIGASAKIYNLNVRGKRGNIVQTFPSVEYDFVPNNLPVTLGDYIHFQWTGSDYNPRRGCNNGEGGPPDKLDDNPQLNSRADRSNIIEQSSNMQNFPADASTLVANSMFADRTTIIKMAMIGQNTATCLTLPQLQVVADQATRENNIFNCAKLNAAATPYFDGGAIQMTKAGTFSYYCSRNNNFSNRDQKGVIVVATSGTSRAIAKTAPLILPGATSVSISQDPQPMAMGSHTAGQTAWTSSVFSLFDKALEVMGVQQTVINQDTTGNADPNTQYTQIDKYGMIATANGEVDNDNTGDGQRIACGHAGSSKPLSVSVVVFAIAMSFVVMTLFA
jgi:hypothetical protein